MGMGGIIRGLWLGLKVISIFSCRKSQNCFNKADELWYCECVTKSFWIAPHLDVIKDHKFYRLKLTLHKLCASRFLF